MNLAMELEKFSSAPLAKLIDLGLDEYLAKLDVIADSATKEFQLESSLAAMQQQWEKVLKAPNSNRN